MKYGAVIAYAVFGGFIFYFNVIGEMVYQTKFPEF
jgi:hypothetical protein